jgi:hypothetical protein
MRVAGRALVVIPIKEAPASNGTGPKGPIRDKVKEDATAADSSAKPHPEGMSHPATDAKGER